MWVSLTVSQEQHSLRPVLPVNMTVVCTHHDTVLENIYFAKAAVSK